MGISSLKNWLFSQLLNDYAKTLPEDYCLSGQAKRPRARLFLSFDPIVRNPDCPQKV